MRLPRGVSYVANDVLGIQMAQVIFGPAPNGIWVDCIICGRRDRLSGDNTRKMTTERAQEIFEAKGWTVKPTHCPDHKGGPRA